ncbi:MAG: transposase [Minicystis sp.]
MADKQRPVVPPTEVQPRPKRRAFSAQFKRDILAEVDACTKPGEIGAILRREGLYSSHLVEWRAARERGELEALAPKKRGPKPAPAPDARDREIEDLKRQLAQTAVRAERAEALIEIQKNHLGRRPSCWTRSSGPVRPWSGPEGAAGCFLAISYP